MRFATMASAAAGTTGRLLWRLVGDPGSSDGDPFRMPLAGHETGLRPLVAGPIGAGRWWTVWMIPVLLIPRRYVEVIPRWARAGARWRAVGQLAGHVDRLRMPQLGGRESVANPAASAVSRSWLRMPAGEHGRPRVGPRRTQNNAPPGRRARIWSHGSSCSNAHPCMPTSRRFPPLPLRTSTAPRAGSRSLSVNASASLIRRPARQSTTITLRSLTPSGSFPAARMTAMIFSTVGGSGGSADSCFEALGPDESWRWWPPTGACQQNRQVGRGPCGPPSDDG